MGISLQKKRISESKKYIDKLSKFANSGKMKAFLSLSSQLYDNENYKRPGTLKHIVRKEITLKRRKYYCNCYLIGLKAKQKCDAIERYLNVFQNISYAEYLEQINKRKIV